MRSSDLQTTRVVFFQVADAASKCQRIVETARSHFLKKDSILFFVEDEKSQRFVDDLLWKLPETSFLPHIAADEAAKEPIPIAITKSKTNVNAALFAFNLCPTPLLLPGFKLIYDFEDLSAPNKQNLSALRFNAYKEARLSLESR